ncbi:MAG: hypothetical protein ACREBR_04940 [bacterium]
MKDKRQTKPSGEFGFFLDFIIKRTSLATKDKIEILEYYADEYYIRGDNLHYLEVKAIIKDLRPIDDGI